MTDHSRVKPLHMTIAGAQAGFGIAATIGDQSQVVINSGALKINDVSLRSIDDKEAPITLATGELTDIAFDLQQKTVHAGLLRLANGKTRVVREADGSFQLVGLFAARRYKPLQDAGFDITLDRAEISGYAVALMDRTFQPATAFDLENVSGSASNIAVPYRNTSPVELALQIKQGGALKAKGAVDLQHQTADIHFEASAVALSPLGSVLKHHTTLTLASGKIGASGRVIWNGKSNPAAIRYTRFGGELPISISKPKAPANSCSAGGAWPHRASISTAQTTS